MTAQKQVWVNKTRSVTLLVKTYNINYSRNNILARLRIIKKYLLWSLYYQIVCKKITNEWDFNKFSFWFRHCKELAKPMENNRYKEKIKLAISW